VACSPASGSRFAIGGTTVQCSARDRQTGIDTGQFVVTVRGADDQLASLSAAVTDVGPGRSLHDKVTSIQAALAADDVTAACELLATLDAELRAQTGKKIPEPTATALRADTARIGAVLGCNGEQAPQE
jgi:hypothetical protein